MKQYLLPTYSWVKHISYKLLDTRLYSSSIGIRSRIGVNVELTCSIYELKNKYKLLNS